MVKIKENLVNEIFGRWQVLQRAEDHISSSGKAIAAWLCECLCEKHTRKIIVGSALKAKRTLSCGCIQSELRENHKKNMTHPTTSLIGQQFGRLLVIERADDYIDPKGCHKAQWKCKCNCGNLECIIVTATHLKTGHTQSCGCLMRETARKICQQRTKNNIYDMDGEYAIGYTSKMEEFWVDKEDVPMLQRFYFHYNLNGYLIADNLDGDPLNLGVSRVLLHRLVMNACRDSMDVDHIRHPDRNEHKVDNRKSNLRFVDDSLNSQNRTKRQDNTSGTPGVYFDKRSNKWVANIKTSEKRITLGYFDNIDDAIKIRKAAELRYFGEYRYDANN